MPQATYKNLEDSVFLSPESYLSPIVLKELFDAFLNNHLVYGGEMREKYGSDYTRALKEAIELSKSERLAVRRPHAYRPGKA